jgi:hypothetical protein
MIQSKRQLLIALKSLSQHKEQWQIECLEPSTFWRAFREIADDILDSAGEDDRAWVELRIAELVEGH